MLLAKTFVSYFFLLYASYQRRSENKQKAKFLSMEQEKWNWPEFSRLESNILDSRCSLSSKIVVRLHVCNLSGHSTQNMGVYGFSLCQGNTESWKSLQVYN